jgi:predicted glycoside hydrolase/deacetylase ChbG (UPF0249 family)
MASHRLIINADDFGFAPGVNRGIAESHAAGTLSSASMMVTTPAFLEAAELARTTLPRLGVGLHLNLITGRPLTDVPTLTDPRTGVFHPLAQLACRALGGRISAVDVRRECDAQIAVLVAKGFAPTHVDSHRHTHVLPGILPAVVASAVAAGIRVVRRPLDRPSVQDPLASAKMAVLHAAWSAAVRGVDATGRQLLARAPHFRGIALQGAPDVEERIVALLDRLPEGATELMLHPGYDDETLAAQDPYRVEREREVAALCSPRVKERLARGDVALVTFGEL